MVHWSWGGCSWEPGSLSGCLEVKRRGEKDRAGNGLGLETHCTHTVHTHTHTHTHTCNTQKHAHQVEKDFPFSTTSLGTSEEMQMDKTGTQILSTQTFFLSFSLSLSL